MPFYVSRHPNLVVGDVAFVPNGAEADDHAAAVEAVRALYADDPGPDVAYGASYDERLAGAGDPDVHEVESAADRAAAEAEAAKSKKK